MVCTPKAACMDYGMWGRVLEVIKHAQFQLDQFTGFGAENRGLPLTGGIVLTTVYALTCYTAITTLFTASSSTVG